MNTDTDRPAPSTDSAPNQREEERREQMFQAIWENGAGATVAAFVRRDQIGAIRWMMRCAFLETFQSGYEDGRLDAMCDEMTRDEIACEQADKRIDDITNPLN